MSLKLEHTNNTKENSIPYNLKEFRKNPKDSDDKIQEYLKQYDPSYSYDNNTNIDWNTFNNGIIQILKNTYPIKKPSTNINKSNTTNIHTKYRELQTDLNYNISKTNITINNTHFIVNKRFPLPGRKETIRRPYYPATLVSYT